MNSREALAKIKELYNLSHQTIPANVRQQRRLEVIEAYDNLNENDHQRLTADQKAWLAGQVN